MHRHNRSSFVVYFFSRKLRLLIVASIANRHHIETSSYDINYWVSRSSLVIRINAVFSYFVLPRCSLARCCRQNVRPLVNGHIICYDSQTISIAVSISLSLCMCGSRAQNEISGKTKLHVTCNCVHSRCQLMVFSSQTTVFSNIYERLRTTKGNTCEKNIE